MNLNRKWDIIGFGAIAVDDLLYIPEFPQPNTKIEVVKRERHGGGLAGTALVAASRLGASCAYFGNLAIMQLSDFTIREFEKEGVDTSLCPKFSNAQPIYSSIIVDQSSSERTILYSLKDFTHPDPVLIPADLPMNCRLIFADTYFLPIMPYLVDISHSCNTPVIADIEDLRIMDYPNTINAIDYLILNRDFASRITSSIAPKDILETLSTSQRNCTVITDGNKGCWFQSKNHVVYHMPAFKIEAVDTTGCGDVFHGAFAAALVRGEDNTSAVIQASAAAALKAIQPGGRAGIPSLEALMNFIKINPEVIPHKVN